MIVKNEKKVFKTYELSKDYISDFLFEEKLKSALYRYGLKNIDSHLLKKILKNKDNMFNLAILYYIGLSLNGNSNQLEIIESALDHKNLGECIINGYEYVFLKNFNKMPFNFDIKKIENESQLKCVFDFIGIGVLPERLSSWLHSDTDSRRNFYDYIETFSDYVLDDFFHIDFGSLCNFIDFDYSKIPPNNLRLLLDSYWGFEFNLLSIESKELDAYIDSIRGSDTDLKSLKCIMEDIYINLAPEPFRISNAYIVDSSNPLFDIFENKDCKYRVISLSTKVAYTEWEFTSYVLNGSKVKALIEDIEKLNQIIASV